MKATSGPPIAVAARDDAKDDARRKLDALIDASAQTVLDPARRIFVNRTLRLEQIRQVGFDMDYTLLPYRKRNMEELSFQLTVEKLIRDLGYPEQIREIRYDPSFVVRGLLVDKKLGNILKIDQFGHVGRGYHGRGALPKDRRRQLYRTRKLRLTSPRYHWIDTLFALPEAVLYADIIDLYELKLKRKRINYRKLFTDIRTAIDECHRDDSLKSIIMADFPRFVRYDPELPLALHKLRSGGKRLFLLTNSYWKYTNAAMSFLLDDRVPEYPSWLNYFDVIIVGAKKPGFFTEERPFREIDRKTDEPMDAPVTRFERQHVYEGGCISRMESILRDRGENILYVGDHIYGDIIRSKKESLWRTALVLEELEEELRLTTSLHHAQADLVDLEERRNLAEHEITQLRLKLATLERSTDDYDDEADEATKDELQRARRALRLSLDSARRNLRTVIERRDALNAEVEQCFNPHWGSPFKEGGENSQFGRQVEDYACIYTSRASNLVFYSPHQFHRAPRHWMPHEKV